MSKPEPRIKPNEVKIVLKKPHNPKETDSIEVHNGSKDGEGLIDDPTITQTDFLTWLLQKDPNDIIKIEDCKIVYTHSSPGCVHFWHDGRIYTSCT